MILDLANEGLSEIAYRRFHFPDGQPHIAIDPSHRDAVASATHIDIVASPKSANDLVDVLLAVDALQSVRPTRKADTITVNVSYLLGARMDRRIEAGQPDTLSVIADVLNLAVAKGARLRVLDPHSPVALSRLPSAEVMVPDKLVQFAVRSLTRSVNATDAPVIVIPDKGATTRTTAIAERLKLTNPQVACSKVRDSATGKLSGFRIDSGDVRGKTALIVDDICDGGGTFTGIANVLRDAGAREVHLCVTHGIFSKGIVISGIDSIFATDSYKLPSAEGFDPRPSAVQAGALDYMRDGKTALTVWQGFVNAML
jgi:ribose-phosphate pyrophosphokinase